MAENVSLDAQVRVVTAPAGRLQVPPPSLVRNTARTRLLAAQPFTPTKYRSEICPCSACCRNVHVLPPSTLRRMNPPPPVRYTLSADSSHTALTSGRASACRSSCVQFAPPSLLLNAVASSPTTHTVPPLASTQFSAFAVP